MATLIEIKDCFEKLKVNLESHSYEEPSAVFINKSLCIYQLPDEIAELQGQWFSFRIKDVELSIKIDTIIFLEGHGV